MTKLLVSYLSHVSAVSNELEFNEQGASTSGVEGNLEV